ncbi:MAG: hypothetical protein V7K92_24745 [Nostoc sp.]|uniref:hypothetical protein n=1 Tax=Nostoc sp. TaxID=1180 RepID=UPI002FF2843C
MVLIKTLHVNCDRYVRVQMAQMDYQERSQKEHYQLLDEPIPLIIFVLKSLSLLRTENEKSRFSSTFYEKK